MRKIRTLSIIVLGMLSLPLSPAVAREIDCPITSDDTRSNGVASGPWRQTPETGRLVNTQVSDTRGRQILICEYAVGRRIVSAQRDIPGGTPYCTARAGGFTCDPTEFADGRAPRSIAEPIIDVRQALERHIPGTGTTRRADRVSDSVIGIDQAFERLEITIEGIIHSDGMVQIPQTWGIDFDTGSILNGTFDLMFQVEVPSAGPGSLYFTPANGARFGFPTTGGTWTRQGCAEVPKTNDTIPWEEWGVGHCFRSSEGRVGRFIVIDYLYPYPAPPNAIIMLEILYKTWE